MIKTKKGRLITLAMICLAIAMVLGVAFIGVGCKEKPQPPTASDYAVQYDLDTGGEYSFNVDLKGQTEFRVKIDGTVLDGTEYEYNAESGKLTIIEIVMLFLDEGEHTVAISTEDGDTEFTVTLIRSIVTSFDTATVTVPVKNVKDIVKDASLTGTTIRNVQADGTNISGEYYSYENNKFTLKKEFLQTLSGNTVIRVNLSNTKSYEFTVSSDKLYSHDYEDGVVDTSDASIYFNGALNTNGAITSEDCWDGKAYAASGTDGNFFIGKFWANICGGVEFESGKLYRIAFDMALDTSKAPVQKDVTFVLKNSPNENDEEWREGSRVTVDLSTKVVSNNSMNARVTFHDWGEGKSYAHIVMEFTADDTHSLLAGTITWEGAEYAWLFDNMWVERIYSPKTLTVETQPQKTNYIVGEKFDASGLTLKATYENGEEETITTGYTFTDAALQESDTSVTITYLGTTVSVPVQVSEPIELSYVKNVDLTLSEDKEVKEVTVGGKTLTKDVDYTVSGTTLKLKATYLETVARTAFVTVTYNDDTKKYYSVSTDVLYYHGYEDGVIDENEKPVYFNGDLAGGAITAEDCWDGKAYAASGTSGNFFIGKFWENVCGGVEFESGKHYRISFDIARDESKNPTQQDIVFLLMNTPNDSDQQERESARVVINLVTKSVTDNTINAVVSFRDWGEGKSYAHVVIDFMASAAQSLFRANITWQTTHYAWLFDNMKVEQFAEVQSVTVKTQPTKTAYLAGEKFDSTGLVLTVTYKNGAVETVTTGYTFADEELAFGTDKVTISYFGGTVDVPVTISATEDKTYTVGSQNDLLLSEDLAVESVKTGDNALTKDTHYTLNENTLSLKAAYLDKVVGRVNVTVTYTNGNVKNFSVTTNLIYFHDYEDGVIDGNEKQIYFNGQVKENAQITADNCWDGKACSVSGNSGIFCIGEYWENTQIGGVSFEPGKRYAISFDMALDSGKNPQQNDATFGVGSNDTNTASFQVFFNNGGSYDAKNAGDLLTVNVTFQTTGSYTYAHITVEFTATAETKNFKGTILWNNTCAWLFDNVRVAVLPAQA